MSAATSEVVVDSAAARVTIWTFKAAGHNTGFHVHEHDYIVVPTTGGRFQMTAEDGSVKDVVQEAGRPYPGTAGTAHDVVSANPEPVSFVEIELKG